MQTGQKFKESIMQPQGGVRMSLLIDGGASPTVGPAIVDSKNRVLGGNFRTMLLQAKTANGYSNYDSGYKERLLSEAAKFGFAPETILSMNRPVLIRRINQNYELKDDKSNLKEVEKIISILNADYREPQRNTDKNAHAVEQFGDIVKDVLVRVPFEEGQSLIKYIKTREADFNQAFMRMDNTGQFRRYISDTGGLTNEGRQIVKAAIEGVGIDQTIAGDLENKGKSHLLNKYYQTIGNLLQLSGTKYDIMPLFQNAFKHFSQATINERNNTFNWNDYLKQLNMFEKRGGAPVYENDVSVLLARHIASVSAKELRQSVQNYARYAAANENPDMFASGQEALSPAQAVKKFIFNDKYNIKPENIDTSLKYESKPQEIDLFGGIIKPKVEPPTFDNIKGKQQDMFPLDKMEMRKGKKQQGLMFDDSELGPARNTDITGKSSIKEEFDFNAEPTGQYSATITKEQETLIKDTLPLVKAIARKYAMPNTTIYDELVGIGNEALIEAGQNFDNNKNTKFSTFVYPQISGKMLNYLNRDIKPNNNIASLNQEVDNGEGGNTQLSELIEDKSIKSPQRAAQDKTNTEVVNEALGFLLPNERQIVEMRSGFGNYEEMSFSEIGEALNISKQRANELYQRALNKLQPLISKDEVFYRRAFQEAKTKNKKIDTKKMESQIKDLQDKIFGKNSPMSTRLLNEKILTPNGQRALGRYKDALIEIIDGTGKETDTYLHEATHAYMDLFLNKVEKQVLLDEMKMARAADVRNYALRNKLSLSEAAEELIAEDFIGYAKDPQNYFKNKYGKNAGAFAKIKVIFQRLLARLKAYFQNSMTIERLYNDMWSGKARNARAFNGQRASPAFAAETAGADLNNPQEVQDAIKEWKEKRTESKYFKKWFKDSKVVDKNGKPLVVYHGTNSKGIKIFDEYKTNDTLFWFSPDKEYIKSGDAGAAGTNILMPVYLNIKKPAGWEQYEKLMTDQIIQQGYDGIILDNNYIVFNSSQIKSANNRGTFDENNPDIYYRKDKNNINNTISKNQGSKIDPVLLTKVEQMQPIASLAKSYIEEVIGKPTDDINTIFKNVEDYYSQVLQTYDNRGNHKKDPIKIGNNEYVVFSGMGMDKITSGGATLNDLMLLPFAVDILERGIKTPIYKAGVGIDPNLKGIKYAAAPVSIQNGDKITTYIGSVGFKVFKAGKNSFYLIRNITNLGQKNRGAGTVSGILSPARSNSSKMNLPQSPEKVKYREEQSQESPPRFSPSQKEMDRLQKIRIDNSNYKAGLEDLQKEARAKGINTNVGIKSRVFAGVDGQIRQIIESNTFYIDNDGNIQITGEGLEPIINDAFKEFVDKNKDKKEIQKDKIRIQEDFNDYMIAQRYKDLKARGDVYVSKEQEQWADNTISSITAYYGDLVKFEVFADRIYKFNQRVLHDNYVQSGVLSQGQYDNILLRNPRYIPMNRVISEIDINNGKYLGNAAIYTIRGSDKAVKNVFESMIRNVRKIITRGYKNILYRDVAALSKDFPEDIAIRKIQHYKIDGKDIFIKPKYKNLYQYFENGKTRYLETSDFIGAGFESLPTPHPHVILKAIRATNNLFRQTMTTFSPRFILRNPMKDINEAFVFHENPIKFLKSYLGGVKAALKGARNKDYQGLDMAGGSFNGFMDMSESGVSQITNDIFKIDARKGWRKGGRLLFKNTLGKLQRANEIAEKATRIAIYKAAKKAGKSDIEAAFEAREGTLDFARTGRAIKSLNRYLPFLNAAIQGTLKTAREFKAHPLRMSAKAFMSITSISIIQDVLYLFLADDKDREEFLEIPAFERRIYWHFKVAGKWWVKIPRPFTLGFVYGALPEMLFENIYHSIKNDNRNNDAKMELLKNTMLGFLDAMSPITSIGDIFPPILKTATEMLVNYNFFTGGEIYPSYLGRLEPSQRKTKNNTALSQFIGERVNISPAMIDHAIGGLTGSLGKDIASLTNIGGTKQNPKRDLADHIGASTLIMRDPIGNNSKSVQDFYKRYNKTSKIWNTLSKKIDNNDYDIEKYAQEKEKDIRDNFRFEGFYDSMSEFNQIIDIIIKNPELTKDEKIQKINELEKQMTDLAREANMLVNSQRN